MKRSFVCGFLVLALGTAMLIADPKTGSPTAAKVTAVHTEPSVAEGELRYRTNCARCHQAPPKFAPAAMGTLIRHMRVRAMITDEDMHAILKFMTQ